MAIPVQNELDTIIGKVIPAVDPNSPDSNASGHVTLDTVKGDLQILPTPASLTASRAIDPAVFSLQIVDGSPWKWSDADVSALVIANQYGICFPRTDEDGSSGGWLRQDWEALKPEWFGGAADSNGTQGNGTDNASAFAACKTIVTALGGKKVVLDTGIYRTTQSWTFVDFGIPVTINGQNAGGTFIFGDFIGAGSGIIDLSNTNDDSYSTKEHVVDNIGFLGRGTVGDPIGLKLENAFEARISNIDAPFRSGKALANSAIVVTNDNNSKFNNVRSQAGFQPEIFSVVTVSITSGSAVITATSGTFDVNVAAGMPVYFNNGGNTGINGAWKGVVSSRDSDTQITLTTNAPSSTTGVKCAVGHVTGSISSGSDQLVLDQNVSLSSAWVGLQVHIPLAATKSDVGKKGVLSTKIAAVSGNTITLAQNATASVSNGVVYFAPGAFIGSFEGDPGTRQTNHSWWANLHIEGFQAAGLIVNRCIFLDIRNLKVHGPGYTIASDWHLCYSNLLISEAKTLFIDGLQSAYGILDHIRISGSRGLVVIRSGEFGHMYKDTPYIIGTELNDHFRLSVEGWLTYELVNFTAGFDIFSGFSFQHLQFANVFRRNGTNLPTLNPAVFSRGIAMVEGVITLADDAIYAIKPPGNFGLMNFGTPNSGVRAEVHYRTSANTSGKMMESGYLGVGVEITTNDLTGTTGTDGKLTIGLDSNGRIVLENRRGFTVKFNASFAAFGDS